MRANCPTRTSRNPPAVSSNLNPSTVLEIPVTLTINGQITETLALIDSGAAGNFIDASFAKTHNIPLVPCVSHLAVAALDGRPLGSGRVQFITEDIQLRVGVLHTESIKLFVFQSPQTPIILGLQDIILLFPGPKDKLLSGQNPADRIASLLPQPER